MSFFEFYEVDVSKILEVIKERKPRKVLIQLPEGFKRHYYEVADSIKKELEYPIDVDVDLSPSYGSCFMDLNMLANYDLVIHLGHDPYPYWQPPNNVVFIDVASRTRISEETLNKLLKFMNDSKISKVAIYTTAQHKALTRSIADKLLNAGVNVVNTLEKSVIFGCWFSDLDTVKDLIDAVIVLAGGSFHALGVGLRINARKPVISLDPYMDSFKVMNDEIYKTLKVRLSKVFEAQNAERWLIVGGVAGQYRPYIIKALIELIKSLGRRYYYASASYINKELIVNIDSKNVDAIVITSCPRIAIEDLRDYHKPILTPGEAFMALKNELNHYRFPF